MLDVVMVARSTIMSVPGGDTVQILATSNQLKRLGYRVDLRTKNIRPRGSEIYHFFNVTRPYPHNWRKCRIVALSPIFIEYDTVDTASSRRFRVVTWLIGGSRLQVLKAIARWVMRRDVFPGFRYLFLGHYRSMRSLYKHAHVLLPNSYSELERLKGKFGPPRKRAIVATVTNGIDVGLVKATRERTIRKTLSSQRRIVICVGRIEPLKNQLRLIAALSTLNVKLLLVGAPSTAHRDYYGACRNRARGLDVEFLGQMNRPELFELMWIAHVHALPSHFETTGLVSLEAAALDCAIVATRKGDQEEYLRNHAHYCEPNSVTSIRSAVERALDVGPSSALRDEIMAYRTWEYAASQTMQAYQAAANRFDGVDL